MTTFPGEKQAGKTGPGRTGERAVESGEEQEMKKSLMND